MPDVRCAFGLVRQTSRRSSLSPSVSNVPGFSRSVPPARYEPDVIRPAVTSPVPGVSSIAGSPVPAAFFGARPGKSNTQTISRASALPVLTPRRRVSTSLSGWAPVLAPHCSSPTTESARAAGLTKACNAQPYGLALHRRTVVRKPFASPRAIGLRRATPSACSRTHTYFNGRT